MNSAPRKTLPTILLASSSPRRREIMQGVENLVEVLSPDIEEGPRNAGESPEEYVSRLSREKAEASMVNGIVGTILAADTTVVLDGEVMGKPATRPEAKHMLQKLQGQVHSVVTGVTVLGIMGANFVTAFRTTSVHVRDFSESEMELYLDSGTPMDRAGAYGVQDMPFNPVTKVDGCYLNVVGLPLCTVVSLMEKVGTVLKLHPRSRVPYFDRCDRCELGCREA